MNLEREQLERVDELKTAPVIGRPYLVPAVPFRSEWLESRTGWSELKTWPWVPVMGPRHEDAEHLNFEWEHYHFDWRFVPRHMLRMSTVSRGRNRFFARVATGSMVHLERLEHRRFVCARRMPIFPRSLAQGWMAALEAAYATHRLRKDCAVCPHRGMRLAGQPTNADGLVICPGHGLRWDLESGRLVPAVQTFGQKPKTKERHP